MVSANPSELISQFLSLPVLVITFVIFLVSLAMLIGRWKTLNKPHKIILVILITMSLSLLIFLIVLAIAFGNNHPPALPTPTPMPTSS